MSSTQVKLKKKQYNQSTDSGAGVVVFDTTSKQIFVGGKSFSTNVKSFTQMFNYTNSSSYYVSGAFNYFSNAAYRNSFVNVDNSYSLVVFDNSAVNRTGTTINVPITLPLMTNNPYQGGENVHYFTILNTTSSNITITIVPTPLQNMTVIGDLTAVTLGYNECIEFSVKVLSGYWAISRSATLYATNVNA